MKSRLPLEYHLTKLKREIVESREIRHPITGTIFKFNNDDLVDISLLDDDGAEYIKYMTAYGVVD